MEKTKYKDIVNSHKPKENVFVNGATAFLIGGVMGVFGQGLVDIYSYYCHVSSKEAGIYMIITLIFLGCLFTGFGWFDKVVNFAKCGLIIPITGFAHAVMSATLEYRREGMITGIGANMFKLAGSVIIYGVISAYTFGLIRLLIMGG